MSFILGKIFSKRAKAGKDSQVAVGAEGSHIRKHIVDHEIVDRYYGHDHGDGHDEQQHHSAAKSTTSPSFMLHLWAVLPILLLEFSSGIIILLVLLAVLINFFIIQMRVHTSKRYVASGIISFMALSVFLTIG